MAANDRFILIRKPLLSGSVLPFTPFHPPHTAYPHEVLLFTGFMPPFIFELHKHEYSCSLLIKETSCFSWKNDLLSFWTPFEYTWLSECKQESREQEEPGYWPRWEVASASPRSGRPSQDSQTPACGQQSVNSSRPCPTQVLLSRSSWDPPAGPWIAWWRSRDLEIKWISF